MRHARREAREILIGTAFFHVRVPVSCGGGGKDTYKERQSHTDTIHKQQVRYGTSACLRLVSMARTRSPVLGASIPLTGRGGAELSLRRSHGRSVALWRVAAGDGARRLGTGTGTNPLPATWARRTLTVHFGAIPIEIDSQDTAGPGSRFLNVHGKSGGPVTAVSQFLK